MIRSSPPISAPTWGLCLALLAGSGLSVALVWHPALLPLTVGVWALAMVLLPAVRRGGVDWFSPWLLASLTIVLGVTLRGLWVSGGFVESARLDELFFLGKAPEFFLKGAGLLLAGLLLLALGYRGTPVPSKPPGESPTQWSEARTLLLGGLLLLLSLGGGVAFILSTREASPDLLSAKRTTIPSLELAGAAYESHGGLRFLASLGFPAHLMLLASALAPNARRRPLKLSLCVLLFFSAALVPLYASLRGTVALNALLSLLLVWRLRPGLPKWIPFAALASLALVIHTMTLLRVERDDESAREQFGLVWGREAPDSLVINRNQIDLFKTAHIVDAVPGELPHAWGATVGRWLLSPIPRAWWPDKPVIQPGPEIGRVVYDQRVAGVPPGLVAEGFWNFGWPGVLAFCWLAGWLMRRLELRFRPAPGEISHRLLIYTAAVLPFGFHALGNSLGMGLHRLVIDGLVIAALCRLVQGGWFRKA